MIDHAIHIRWMIRRDMPRVIGVEESCFTEPWCEDDFIQCLNKRNCVGMVAEVASQIEGFMMYELQPKQLEIVNFAVDTDSHRLGIGEAMIAKLKGKLSPDRRSKIVVHPPESFLDAHLFFRSMGFRATGVGQCGSHGDGAAYRFEHSVNDAPVSRRAWSPRNRISSLMG